jgi:hypothetical protein
MLSPLHIISTGDKIRVSMSFCAGGPISAIFDFFIFDDAFVEKNYSGAPAVTKQEGTENAAHVWLHQALFFFDVVAVFC